jgi:predicted aminopeptidase
MKLSSGRKIFSLIIFSLLFVLLWQYKLLNYGLSQASGQINILYNAKAIENLISDSSFPDSLKQKINLIQEIKKFATDSLGLNSSENYITYYDQQNKPILWVLTVCDQFSLNPHQWHFPFLGDVSYKGFFNQQSAKEEENEFMQKGYDTDIGEANAWSTLGWFNDPILSSMLHKQEGSLADLIIHELTHASIYIKDGVDYNENLASFVGHKGALHFLKYKFGDQSNEYREYKNHSDDRQKFISHILRGCKRLDSLYLNLKTFTIDEAKINAKEKLISEIMTSIDSISFHHPEKYHQYMAGKELPNNAWFYGFIQYRKNLESFEEECNNGFKSNLKLYLAYLIKKAQNNISD